MSAAALSSSEQWVCPIHGIIVPTVEVACAECGSTAVSLDWIATVVKKADLVLVQRGVPPEPDVVDGWLQLEAGYFLGDCFVAMYEPEALDVSYGQSDVAAEGGGRSFLPQHTACMPLPVLKAILQPHGLSVVEQRQELVSEAGRAVADCWLRCRKLQGSAYTQGEDEFEAAVDVYERARKQLPHWHVEAPHCQAEWEAAALAVGVSGPGAMQQARRLANAACKALGLTYKETAPADIEQAVEQRQTAVREAIQLLEAAAYDCKQVQVANAISRALSLLLRTSSESRRSSG